MTANTRRRERSVGLADLGSRLASWSFLLLTIWALALAGCGSTTDNGGGTGGGTGGTVQTDAAADHTATAGDARAETGAGDSAPDRADASATPDSSDDVSIPPDSPVVVIPDASDGGPATLRSIAVTRPNASIANGTSEQFTATGTYSDNSTRDITSTVTWDSSTTSVATINTAGLAHAVGPGNTTIHATLGAIIGSASLQVTAATLMRIDITPPSPTIADGTTVQLAATGVFTDTTTQTLTGSVTWSSGTTSVATVSSGGLVTAQGQGTSTISATLNGVTGTTVLTVSSANLLSISVTPTRPTMAVNTNLAMTANGIYSNGSVQNLTTQVTWASTATTVASVATDGVVRGLLAGQTTIRATLNGVTGSTLVTVNNATLISIAVSPGTATIAMGTGGLFSAVGTFRDDVAPFTQRNQDISQTVTWDTSDHGVATISNADGSRGVVSSVAVGSADVTATQASVTGTGSVIVTNASLQSITINPTAPSAAKGTTVQFHADAVFSDSSTQDLTGAVTWGAFDGAIASVSNGSLTKGVATALGVGTTQITVIYNGVTYRTTLTVTQATLDSISVTPSSPSVAKGSRQQYRATGIYSDNSAQDLTGVVDWSSSDNTLATIDTSGSATPGQAIAVEAGDVTITATGTNGTTPVVGTATLHITPATLSFVVITPPNPSIAKGTTVAFTAEGTYSDGSTQDLTTQAIWGSTSTNVASVSNSSGSQGLATARNAGVTTITASVGGFTVNTTLAVTAATLQLITVTPATPSIPRGTTQQFRAVGTYSDGSTQDITSIAAWGSSDGTVASVSNGTGSHGFSTGLAAGTTTISAVSGVRTGSTQLTVTAATLRSIAISPGSQTIAKGTTVQFSAIGSYSDGSTQVITTQVTWTSDSAAASVSNASGSQGLATGDNAGSANITATLGAITRSVTLSVSGASLDSISITPDLPAPDIANGTTIQFEATGHYSDNTTADLTASASWTSATPIVAVISNATGSRGLASAIGVGMTGIKATFGGRQSNTVTLTVHNATVETITISPTDPMIALGNNQAFTVMAHYSDNTDADVTTQAVWTSGTPAVATIGSNTGVANSVSLGTTTITATFGGAMDSTTLEVTDAVLVSIDVAPPNRHINPGANVQYSALGHYSDGTSQIITDQVTWSTTDSNIAIIDTNGFATGVTAGTVTVTATLSPGTPGTTSLIVDTP